MLQTSRQAQPRFPQLGIESAFDDCPSRCAGGDAVRIRAIFPFPCWVTGPNADSLSPVFRFFSRGCLVTGSLLGEDPLSVTEPGDQDPWFRRVHNLSVEIDEADTDLVTRVVASNDAETIIGSLLKPANRIIRSLRNFGLVTHVREFRSNEVAGDRWLNLLAVHTSPDGATWAPVGRTPDDLGEFVLGRAMLRRESFGQFRVANLPEVQEAIEDGLIGGPEKAFLANTLEYLRRGDLRVAVVESIICLEILLGQLLPQLLESRGGAANSQLTERHRAQNWTSA